MDQQESTEYGIKTYFAIIRERIWLVIALFTLCVTGTAIVSYKITPVFRATAQIKIEKRTSSLVGIQDVYRLEARPDNYYETQYRFLQSRTLCRTVFEKLELNELQKYSESKEPLKAFVQDIIVEPIIDTFLVDVSYEHESPELAAQIVNALADEYIVFAKREKNTVSEAAENKLVKQIPILRKALTASQQTLRDFEQSESTISFDKRKEIVYSALSTLNSKIVKLNQDIAAARSKCASVQKAKTIEDMLSLPDVVNNPFVQAFLREKLLLEAKKTELSLKYSSTSQEITSLANGIRTIEGNIKEEADKITKSIITKLNERELEKNELEGFLKKEEQLANQIDARMSRYESLKTDVESNRKIYDEFVQCQKELQSVFQFDPGAIQIIDRAEVSTIPVWPKKGQNIILAAVLSILAGVALTFLVEHLDDTIKGYEDVRKYVQLPLLGIIPSMKKGKKNEKDRDLIAHVNPKSNVSELYRSLRSSLIYASSDESSKAFVVTSPSPLEGKTTTAINLAITLAQTGKKVLLVDSDLRKSRIHKTFNVDRANGLTNYLAGEIDTDKIISNTDIENLSFIPSGPTSHFAADLIGSPRMKEFIGNMKTRFDYIILDSPPLCTVTDAAILTVITDAVIQVILSGRTSRKVVAHCRDILSKMNANMVGVVLNNFKPQGNDYHKYYDYSYSYSND
jgi:capsular exopolysaccharide synthesis family protein